MTTELETKARAIRLLVCDVDGTLTNGHLSYGDEGEVMRSFHCHDGQGIKCLVEAGLDVAVITTSPFTPNLDKRFTHLNIRYAYFDQKNKISAFETLLKEADVDESAVAYIGDDVPDLPLIERAGLGIAVANAVSDIQAKANWVTQNRGGHGAVREACEFILKSQGHWESALQQFY